jgi:hypothetical protein
MTTFLEQVEAHHALDAIYGWVGFHAGLTVEKYGFSWTLLPARRERTLTGDPAVVVSLESAGTANFTFTWGGPDDVSRVECDEHELRVWQGDREQRFTLDPQAVTA